MGGEGTKNDEQQRNKRAISGRGMVFHDQQGFTNGMPATGKKFDHGNTE
jgi:hypothetical protein